ncbi:hypothetical protein BRC93_00270 [Halobacteriales archaeon QS_5_70_15]|nr:MAG: hypothetical protein BRC93_00270 [Halobacteriales archaeon QS_5_70_15]
MAADVAAADLLAERVTEWEGFDYDRRRRTLRALRLSLDRCPNCGAGQTAETQRVDPCCQKPHLLAESVCEACGTAVADAAERGEGREADSSAVGRLLSLMDGLVADSRVAVVGTTNRPGAIDPALRRPGRFDREIEIGVPSGPTGSSAPTSGRST